MVFIENGDANYKFLDKYSSTGKSDKYDRKLVNLLQGQINSLQNMMAEKDHLLERMGNAFKEKESIISTLKHKIDNNEYGESNYSEKKKRLTTKQVFQPSPHRRESDSYSERSLRSLEYLMKKTENDHARKTRIKIQDEMEYLSHSHTETLSGSSTTSIVAKCYDKSWKQGSNFRYD